MQDIDQAKQAKELQRAARYLGAAYLSYTLLGMVNTFFLKPGITDVQSFAETAARFRLAQVTDLLMYSLVIVASWASYLVTRSVHRDIALLALLFRFGEALLGCVAGIVVLMPLILLEGGTSWSGFEPEQLRTLATLIFKLSGTAWNILFVLMGIGAFAFISLFYVSKMVPRWLTLWGLFTYSSMVFYGLVKLCVADAPSQMKFIMYPGALFEVLFGVWLLVKGASGSRMMAPSGAKTRSTAF